AGGRAPAAPAPEGQAAGQGGEPRALAVGERLQDHHRALYDRREGTYDYYVGGVLWAKWHPWRRELRIRPLGEGAPEEKASWPCRWDASGALHAPQGGEAACRALLKELARRLAR
ncbi:MAG: hypothetical protein D6809_06335, partial [Gammaproteobacteria bacterium]